MFRNAKWIWVRQKNYHTYNQTIIACKSFEVNNPVQASLNITADSFYRLLINDQWINDGPGRSWPDHYQYDRIDVSGYIRSGRNEIRIIARYFGAGDFHRVPRQAGLLVWLSIESASGETTNICSDRTWKAAEAKQWIQNTPKISIQMEPAEYYDARLSDRPKFQNAAELFDYDKGPWKNLYCRDVALLTRNPVNALSVGGASIVNNFASLFCLPAARLCHPHLVEANYHISMPCGMASVLKIKKACILKTESSGFRTVIDGVYRRSGIYRLKPGKHLILCLGDPLFDMHGKEKTLSFEGVDVLDIENPLDSTHENAWCFIKLSAFLFSGDDMTFFTFTGSDAGISDLLKKYNRKILELTRAIKTVETFRERLKKESYCLSSRKMFVHDPYRLFQKRCPVQNARHLMENAARMIHEGPEYAIIHPSNRGDVEITIDFGEERCGYFAFEIMSHAGVKIDIFGVEYITPDGRVQHTAGNRNGMRYITKDGWQSFVSLKRRAARYVFITLRDQRSPVKIRNFKVIESTYPVHHGSFFRTGDEDFNHIWDISLRTLKLCMEDTYTDCPLYEQTLWVGDARNESLYGYLAYGAYDIAARCIKLAAQSLERFPIVGCQVSSSWDCLLPAWSFLWGISVWEYYWHTGDECFLRQMWPYVYKNLEGSQALMDDSGLFSGPFWNMFDWTNIDQEQRTVIHNSMFFVGALKAGEECAKALKKNRPASNLATLRSQLVNRINRLWDINKKSYPDSIHSDGSISQSTSQHTSFLAVLYDIVDAKNKRDAVNNLINPPEGMVRIGSPFATQFLYEAFEKQKMYDEILGSIKAKFTPMLKAGASTVWETFDSGSFYGDEFPTRSHCHAWSCAPIYFFTRIILGIKQTALGGMEYTISPWLSSLRDATGAVNTPHGLLRVRWELKNDVLNIRITAPKKIDIKFIKNESHHPFKVQVRKVFE